MTLLKMEIAGTEEEPEGTYLHMHFSDGTWAFECPIGASNEEALATFQEFISFVKAMADAESKMH